MTINYQYKILHSHRLLIVKQFLIFYTYILIWLYYGIPYYIKYTACSYKFLYDGQMMVEETETCRH
jgi:hypothetical protein